MRVFVEDCVPLRLAHLLEDHLLGHLRGNAPQHVGRLVVANLAAHFYFRRQLPRLFQRNLVHRVFDQLRRLHHRLEDVRPDLAGLLVQLRAHVFLRLVILPRRQRDRILDRRNHNLRIDALIPAQRLNALVKHTRHLLLSVLELCLMFLVLFFLFPVPCSLLLDLRHQIAPFQYCLAQSPLPPRSPHPAPCDPVALLLPSLIPAPA